MAVDVNALVKPSLYFAQLVAAIVVLGVTADRLFYPTHTLTTSAGVPLPSCLFNAAPSVCHYAISAASIATAATLLLASLQLAAAFTSFAFSKGREILSDLVLAAWWLAAAIVFALNNRLPPRLESALGSVPYPGEQPRQAVTAIAFSLAAAAFGSALLAWFAQDADPELDAEYRDFRARVDAARDAANLRREATARRGSWKRRSADELQQRMPDRGHSERMAPARRSLEYPLPYRGNSANSEVAWASTPVPAVTRAGVILHRHASSQSSAFEDLIVPAPDPTVTSQDMQPKLTKTASWQ